ncbi:MAG: nucleotide exchange factor GrpE [Gammaproteobacteria bacterium]|nr:nucleotide exchange factor GrpE [Gammaproteobacteria bacterium]
MSDEEILDKNEQPETEQQSADEVVTEDVELSAEQDLMTRLEAAEQKAADHLDQLLRTKADMENLRRRTQKDLENAHKFALEKFVTELLSVKDSLEMGLNAAAQQSTVEKLIEGTEMTLNMLNSVFEKFNVEELNPLEQKFNPEHHQAMSMQESAEHEPNTVIAVMQKGYLLNDRLVRPAMVMVSRAPAE